MFKKLFLIFIFLLFFSTNNFILATYANTTSPAIDPNFVGPPTKQQIIDQKNQKMLDERNTACEASNNCLDKANFTIPVSSMFNFGGGLTSNISGSSAEEKINSTLGYVIQKLMIALGIISLFVMTIGAGYIILYHGQDDLLSKGKNIFMAGIISLVVALSSYYIVSLVRYLIFT